MIEVVAGAVIRHGRVLAARRRGEPAGWEFPGGKVEPPETPQQALARELLEELQLPVTVGARLGAADDGRISIVLFAATSAAEPVLGPDHDELRWLAAADLAGVDWLPIDVALLPALRPLLQWAVEG